VMMTMLIWCSLVRMTKQYLGAITFAGPILPEDCLILLSY
jgi:hypothetical protein